MRDIPISVDRANKLHPKVRQEVIDIISEVEKNFPLTVKVRIAQGLRTEKEQNDLYALGRTKKNPDGATAKKPLGNIVTKAKFGQSYHCFGLAIDFCLMYDKEGDGKFEEVSWDINKDFDKDSIKDWQEVVKSFEAKGWYWGGNFSSLKDYPHLEKKYGLTWQKLLDKYNNKEVDAEGYVKI